MEYFITFNNKEFVSIGVDSGFGVFWSDTGFDILNEIVLNKKELIDKTIIKDEKNKNYTILKFLDKIERLKIR